MSQGDLKAGQSVSLCIFSDRSGCYKRNTNGLSSQLEPWLIDQPTPGQSRDMRAVHVDVGLEPTTKKAGISPPAPCVFISCGVVTSIQRIAAHCDREKLAAFFLSRGSSPLSRRPEINQPFQEPVACSFRAFCVWLFRFRTQIPLALGRFKTRRLIRLPTTGIGMVFVAGLLWSVHPHQKRMNSSSAHDLTVSWLPRGD